MHTRTLWLVENEYDPQLPEEYNMVVESKFLIDVKQYQIKLNHLKELIIE